MSSEANGSRRRFLGAVSTASRPFLIEDPIQHENPQALAQVRAQTRLPLAM